MFSVVIKRVFIAVCTMAIVTSCGNDEEKRASDLLMQAQHAFESGDYQSASLLLDSIDISCKNAVKTRREAMHLKPQIVEKKSLSYIEQTDSLLAETTVELDSLMKLLRLVKNPVEDYYVYGPIKNTDATSDEGIHARLSKDGMFYMISSAKKGTLSESVTLSSSGETASTPNIKCDGERNDRSGATEVITYLQSECDTIGKFVVRHYRDAIVMSINGKKTRNYKLSETQREAISTLYQAGEAIRNAKLLSIQKEKYERMLKTSRSQIARTFTEVESE